MEIEDEIAMLRIKELSTKKKAIKKNDEEWRHIIYLIYGEICIVCGAPRSAKIMQAHHCFLKRDDKPVRWSLLNGCPLCFNCHDRADSIIGSGRIEMALRRINGETWYDNARDMMQRISVTTRKMMLEDYILAHIGLKRIRTILESADDVNSFRVKYIVNFTHNNIPMLN